MPAGHKVQFCVPFDDEYFPASHGVQDVAPSCEKVPMGQVLQTELFVAYSADDAVPAAHFMQVADELA